MDEGIPAHSSYLHLGNCKFLWHGLIMSSIEVLHNFQGPLCHSMLVSDWLKKVFSIAWPTQHFVWRKLESRCSLSSQIGDVLHNLEVDWSWLQVHILAKGILEVSKSLSKNMEPQQCNELIVIEVDWLAGAMDSQGWELEWDFYQADLVACGWQHCGRNWEVSVLKQVLQAHSQEQLLPFIFSWIMMFWYNWIWTMNEKDVDDRLIKFLGKEFT